MNDTTFSNRPDFLKSGRSSCRVLDGFVGLYGFYITHGCLSSWPEYNSYFYTVQVSYGGVKLFENLIFKDSQDNYYNQVIEFLQSKEEESNFKAFNKIMVAFAVKYCEGEFFDLFLDVINKSYNQGIVDGKENLRCKFRELIGE